MKKNMNLIAIIILAGILAGMSSLIRPGQVAAGLGFPFQFQKLNLQLHVWGMTKITPVCYAGRVRFNKSKYKKMRRIK